MIYQINSGQRNVRMLHRGIKAGLTSAEWANVIGVHWRRDEETHNRHSSIFLADLVRLSVQKNGPIMSLLNWVKFVSQCLVYRMHNIRIEEKLRLFHIFLKTHRQQSKEGFQCYLIILDCLFSHGMSVNKALGAFSCQGHIPLLIAEKINWLTWGTKIKHE